MKDRSVNERFRHFLSKTKGSDEPSVYKELHITTQTWSNYKHGTRPITLDDLISIVRYFKQLNARWLLTNEGNMTEEANSYKAEQLSESNQTTPPYKCKICDEKDKQLNLMQMLIDELKAQREIYEERRRNCPGESSGGVESPGKTG